MTDGQTQLAMAVVSFMGIGAFCLCQRLAKHRWWGSPWVAGTVALTAMNAAAVYCLSMNASLAWAEILPVASVVIWSNFVPVLLISSGAGLIHGARLISRPLQGGVIAAIASLTLLTVSLPVVRPLIFPARLAVVEASRDHSALADRPDSNSAIVKQTHRSTCGPAAAATLLRLNEISSDEPTMVRACLTCDSGTEALGLYRGLTLGTANSDKRARVVQGQPSTWQSTGQLPNVSIVYFPKNEYAQPNRPVTRPRLFGRTGDAGHVVVILERRDDGWLVMDPAVGQTVWTDQEFQRRYTGDSIYLAENHQ